jgi:hypothetical protein
VNNSGWTLVWTYEVTELMQLDMIVSKNWTEGLILGLLCTSQDSTNDEDMMCKMSHYNHVAAFVIPSNTPQEHHPLVSFMRSITAYSTWIPSYHVDPPRAISMAFLWPNQQGQREGIIGEVGGHSWQGTQHIDSLSTGSDYIKHLLWVISAQQLCQFEIGN